MKKLILIVLPLLLFSCHKKYLPEPEKTIDIEIEVPSPDNNDSEAAEQPQEDQSADYTIKVKVFEQPQVTAVYELYGDDNDSEVINYLQNDGRWVTFSYQIDDEIYDEVNVTLDFPLQRMTNYEYSFYYGDHYIGGGSGNSNWGTEFNLNLE